ncbi:hypothetical protein SteCoe_33858 [Stentor coeruleus]|uniref:Uncharacterized protein n=1 Tax=Stentor coeruleus TaxID=5963 RepID=A0A1R2AVV0_9CILI|nr:hypothetical protein SteCoe_33858 [Stentor coeruleus]
MSRNCSYPDCQKKASVFCDCSRNNVYLCLAHLGLHTKLPGLHNTKRVDQATEVSGVQACSNAPVRCEGTGCSGLAKFVCFCTCKSLCYNCLDDHLTENLKVKHTVEAKYFNKPTYEDMVHPLDMFLKRAQCETIVSNKIKTRNIGIKDILKWDMRALNAMTETLGLTSTVKYSLWEEINYIRIVTEKTYLRNDYMARLIFGIEEQKDSEIIS